MLEGVCPRLVQIVQIRVMITMVSTWNMLHEFAFSLPISSRFDSVYICVFVSGIVELKVCIEKRSNLDFKWYKNDAHFKHFI